MIFIYRAIDAGMVSFADVQQGNISLAELVGISHYLDMKSDIEYAAMNDNVRGKGDVRRGKY